mmetsp:Transcript_15558/g.29991  ORF Transcript_15558/g.29991 Transcript_15558/m.29991 type:complete len:607 (+) Transcript_15558:112-1932(+)
MEGMDWLLESGSTTISPEDRRATTDDLGSVTCQLSIDNSASRACQSRNLSKLSTRFAYAPRIAEHKRCRMSKCNKFARGNTGLCVKHGGGRRCTYAGCTKSARDSLNLCIAHGGGKRCMVIDCTKSAIWGSNMCIAHGGGRRCKENGGNNIVTGYAEHCVAHEDTGRENASEFMRLNEDVLNPFNFFNPDCFCDECKILSSGTSGSTGSMETGQCNLQGLRLDGTGSISLPRSHEELQEGLNSPTTIVMPTRVGSDISRTFNRTDQPKCIQIPRKKSTWWDSTDFQLPSSTVCPNPKIGAPGNTLAISTEYDAGCSAGDYVWTHEAGGISLQHMHRSSKGVCSCQHAAYRYSEYNNNGTSNLPITYATIPTPSRKDLIDTSMRSKGANVRGFGDRLVWDGGLDTELNNTIWDDQLDKCMWSADDAVKMMSAPSSWEAALVSDIPDEGLWSNQNTSRVLPDYNTCKSICNNSSIQSNMRQAVGGIYPHYRNQTETMRNSCTMKMDGNNGESHDMRCAPTMGDAAGNWGGLQGEMTTPTTFSNYSVQKFLQSDYASRTHDLGYDQCNGQNTWCTCLDCGCITRMNALGAPQDLETETHEADINFLGLV